MAQFYDTDFGFGRMTEAEIDAKALAGGVLGGIGYGYATRGKFEPRHGYSAKWINKGGMGNHGVAILVGLTYQKREIIREGKRNRVMADHGCDAETAAAIVACGHLEHGVVALALRERHNPIWQTYPGHMNGVRNWLADYDVPSDGLSVPRLDKVAAIIVRLQRTMADAAIFI